jgi:hypothetical protein
MAKRTKASDSGKSLGPRSITKFAASMSGDVILPGDRLYHGARRVWNHAVNVQPAIIARCASREDVVRAVEFARDHELLTAIRSGGHSFAGHGVCEGGMVIDLCSMKRAEIDPLDRSIKIETGVIAGELDCLTQAFKLAVPLGSCPSVGVSGYSLGGGEGSLTPKLGYGCDSPSHQYTRATTAASESVALQYAISQSTEQSQRTILPVVTRPAAPQSFQLNRLCPAGQRKES